MSRRTIALLGAGRLAHSFASALMDSGVKINCIYDRDADKAAKFAKQFSVSHHVSQLEEIPTLTTRFFVAVSDSALPAIVIELQKQKFPAIEKYFIHFSGAEDSRVFGGLKKRGVYTGSLHLLQTFPTTDIIPLKGCGAALESGSAKCLTEMSAIAKKLKLNPFTIKTENKSIYHIMGVILSNFLTGNLAAAEEIFTLLGIKNISFADLALPIIIQTVNNAFGKGVAHSLSGPIERNDAAVIEKHLKALKGNKNLNHLLQFYIEQSKQLVRTAAAKNPGKDYNSVDEVLTQL